MCTPHDRISGHHRVMAGDRWHHGRGLVVGSCEPLGLLIANLSGWKPDAGVSGWVNGPLTSLAIVELLLAVELRRVLPDARRLLPPFLVSVLATVFAVLVFGWVLRPWLSEDASALAAVYTATFTGGTLNFVSVGRSLAIPDDLFAIATAADYVVFTGWFLLSLLIGRERQASGVDSIASDAHTSDAQMADGPRALGIAHQPKSLASGLLWGGAAMLIAELVLILLRGLAWDVPAIIVLTTVALLMAQLPTGGSRVTCYGMGQVLIQPFFAVIGLSTTVGGLFGLGLPVLVYAIPNGWDPGSRCFVGAVSTALGVGRQLGRIPSRCWRSQHCAGVGQQLGPIVVGVARCGGRPSGNVDRDLPRAGCRDAVSVARQLRFTCRHTSGFNIQRL
ncbi:hypothetical protein SynA1560_01653 [Synechococcus sp. A15-60]|nr:hypothetical protein SynA1560_01653 [Synechococcus sp. A15-60]